jgi:broad specificity phosphatase PhoE
MGDWTGKDRSKTYTKEVIDQINADVWNFSPPNGESQHQVEERMLDFVTSVVRPLWAENKKEQHVVVMGHGLAFKCLLRGILNFDAENTTRIQLENTSITELGLNDKGWHLIRLNDCAHLK